jgi:RNA polymerase-binding transcription factor DksA
MISVGGGQVQTMKAGGRFLKTVKKIEQFRFAYCKHMCQNNIAAKRREAPFFGTQTLRCL